MKNLVYFILLISFITTSCKKSREITISPAITDAKISKVIIVDTTLYTFGIERDTSFYSIFYDANNNVDSIYLYCPDGYPSTIIKTFSYFSGYYVIKTYDPPPYYEQTVVQVNDKGLITYSRDINSTSGTTSSYNDQGQLQSVSDSQYTTGSGGILYYSYTYVANYQWSGNNCIKESTDQQQYYNYSFDGSRQGQTADVNRISDFLSYGRSTLNSINVPTIIQNTTAGGTNTTYQYQYDSKGRIIQMQSGSQTFYYQYY